MNKLFLWTCALFLSWSYVFAADAPTIAPKITEQQADMYKTRISQALNTYLRKYDASQIRSRLLIVQERIQKLKQTNPLTTLQLFLLDHLAERIAIALNNDASGTWAQSTWAQSTSAPAAIDKTPSVTTSMTSYPAINVREFERGPSLLLAGVRSFPVSQFVITAQLEDVQLQEITVTSNISFLDQVLKSVRIYDSNGNFVAEDIPQWWSIYFSNLNYKLARWSHTLYLVLMPFPVWHQKVWPQKSIFSLHLTVTKARGLTSQADLNLGLDSVNTEELTIAPSKITWLRFVSSFGGTSVDTSLSDGIENTLGILQITATTTANTNSVNGSPLATVIRQLVFNVQDNTEAKNLASTLRLKRISGKDGDGILWSVIDNVVTFDLTQFAWWDNILQNDLLGGFELIGSPTLNTTTKESARINLINLDDAGITYSTDDPAAQTIDGAYIGVQSIDGTLVIENN